MLSRGTSRVLSRATRLDAIRHASGAAREHKGVVISRAEISGKVYTRIRDMDPSRRMVYLHEADPLNPRSAAIDAKEGDSVEFDLDDNMRPTEIQTKSSKELGALRPEDSVEFDLDDNMRPTEIQTKSSKELGGGIIAADLWKEKIPPPAVSDDLAPVSSDIVQLLPNPDEVTASSLNSVESYIHRVIYGPSKPSNDSFSPLPSTSEGAPSRSPVKKGEPKYPAFKTLVEATRFVSDVSQDTFGLDTETLLKEFKAQKMTDEQAFFTIEALIRNRQLSLLKFGNPGANEELSLDELREFAEKLETFAADKEVEAEEEETEAGDEIGASLLAREDTEGLKEDTFEDLIALRTPAPSVPPIDPLDLFKSVSKK